jgi:hypothetical protein
MDENAVGNKKPALAGIIGRYCFFYLCDRCLLYTKPNFIVLYYYNYIANWLDPPHYSENPRLILKLQPFYLKKTWVSIKNKVFKKIVSTRKFLLLIILDWTYRVILASASSAKKKFSLSFNMEAN